MLDKLKADFDGILELVNKAPQALQETAFKMILEQWFAANVASPPPAPPLPSATITPLPSLARRPGCREAIPNGKRNHYRDSGEGVPLDRPWRSAGRIGHSWQQQGQ